MKSTVFNMTVERWKEICKEYGCDFDPEFPEFVDANLNGYTISKVNKTDHEFECMTASNVINTDRLMRKLGKTKLFCWYDEGIWTNFTYTNNEYELRNLLSACIRDYEYKLKKIKLKKIKNICKEEV